MGSRPGPRPPHYFLEGQANLLGRDYRDDLKVADHKYDAAKAREIADISAAEAKTIYSDNTYGVASKNTKQIDLMEAMGIYFAEYLRVRYRGGIPEVLPRIGRIFEAVGRGVSYEAAFQKEFGSTVGQVTSEIVVFIDRTVSNPGERLKGTRYAEFRAGVVGRPLSNARPRHQETQEVEAETDGPAQAAAFFLLKRTGGKPLPVEKLLAAKRHKETMPMYSIAHRSMVTNPAAESELAANLGTWRPVGPGNIGGRTRSLVVRPDNPSIMYAGAVGGGVWKTTDAGATWKPLTDLLPIIGIGCLAMDPNNPDTLYAGTGEYFNMAAGDENGDSIRGVGIYKTTNGGATWTLLSSTMGQEFYYVNKIVVSPNNSKNIYAATWHGVYLSIDAGATWKLVLDQSGNTQPGCQDLAIRTDQPTDYVFATCAFDVYDNPAIYRNTNAAGSGKWNVVFTTDNMSRTSLALAPSNQNIIYAVSSSNEDGDYRGGLLGVFRSTSSGDSGSWTTQVTNQDSNFLNTLLLTNPRDAYADVCYGGTRSLGNQGDYDQAIAVDPVNPNTVWVGGIDLFRSDDGGQNWGLASYWEANPPQFAHADNHVIVFAPGYDGASNQTMFVSSDGGVFRTDNALAATATGDQATCFPYPASVEWTSLNNSYAVTQFYHGAVYPGGAVYMGGTQDNATVRGSDGSGLNGWTTPAFTGDGGYVAIDPTNPNTFYFAGTNLSISKTSDAGYSQNSAVKGITESGDNFLWVAPLVMDPANSKRLYTGGRTLWRSVDGAKTWTAASTADSSKVGSISAITISPSDANHVAFGTENGYIFTSKSATTTTKSTAWSSSQPRMGYVSSLAYDPTNNNTLYVTYSLYKDKATESHVYKSTDGGVTWHGIDGSGSNGIPDIPVYSLIVDPQNSSSLYLGSDIGLFASTNGGSTWSRDSNPFADAVTEILVLDRSAGQSNLIAFTHGRGVWKTALPGSGAACDYTLTSGSTSEGSIEMPAIGGSFTFNVGAGANCVWSALTTNNDFEVSSPAMGKGKGSFTVNSRYVNTGTQPDTTTISVQNQAIAISQDGAMEASNNFTSATAFALGAAPAVVVEDTTSAPQSPVNPVHSCTKSADFRNVWFSLKAPAAGKLSASYYDTQPNGGDAGSVFTLYTLQNGRIGTELGCYVVPQGDDQSAGYTVDWTAAAGATYLIEISATTSMGGSLSMWVTQSK
jgi:hypothetical protein